MANNKVISQIKLGNTTYDIRDTHSQTAIHMCGISTKVNAESTVTGRLVITDGCTFSSTASATGTGTSTIPTDIWGSYPGASTAASSWQHADTIIDATNQEFMLICTPAYDAVSKQPTSPGTTANATSSTTVTVTAKWHSVGAHRTKTVTSGNPSGTTNVVTGYASPNTNNFVTGYDTNATGGSAVIISLSTNTLKGVKGTADVYNTTISAQPSNGTADSTYAQYVKSLSTTQITPVGDTGSAFNSYGNASSSYPVISSLTKTNKLVKKSIIPVGGTTDVYNTTTNSKPSGTADSTYVEYVKSLTTTNKLKTVSIIPVGGNASAYTTNNTTKPSTDSLPYIKELGTTTIRGVGSSVTVVNSVSFSDGATTTGNPDTYTLYKAKVDGTCLCLDTPVTLSVGTTSAATAATNTTTVVTSGTTNWLTKTTVATPGTATTVATGSVASDGGGAVVVTGGTTRYLTRTSVATAGDALDVATGSVASDGTGSTVVTGGTTKYLGTGTFATAGDALNVVTGGTTRYLTKTTVATPGTDTTIVTSGTTRYLHTGAAITGLGTASTTAVASSDHTHDITDTY